MRIELQHRVTVIFGRTLSAVPTEAVPASLEALAVAVHSGNPAGASWVAVTIGMGSEWHQTRSRYRKGTRY